MAKKKTKKKAKKKVKPCWSGVVTCNAGYEGPCGPNAKIWLTLSKPLTPKAIRKKSEQWLADIKGREDEKIVDVMTGEKENMAMLVIQATWADSRQLRKHVILLSQMLEASDTRYEEESDYASRPVKVLSDRAAKHNVRVVVRRPEALIGVQKARSTSPNYGGWGTMMGPMGEMMAGGPVQTQSAGQTRQTEVKIGNNLVYVGDQIGANAVVKMLQDAFMKASAKSIKDAVLQVLNDIRSTMQSAGYPDPVQLSISKMISNVEVVLSEC